MSTKTELHVETVGSRLIFTWQAQGVQIVLSRIKDSGRECEAYLTFHKSVSESWRLMTSLKSHLANGSARDTLAKRLKILWPGPDWVTLIETVCVRTIEHVRQVQPMEWLEDDETLDCVPFLLSPLVHADQPTLIFAPDGAGKSYLGLYLSLLLTAGGAENGLACSDHNVLYLDWELDKRIMNTRFMQLKRGHPSWRGQRFRYLKMDRPLIESLDVLQDKLSTEDINIVILDSVAPAAGSDLLKTEAPLQLYAALRSLHVTPILLAHVPKQVEEGQARTAYGNAFFGYLARNQWEIQPIREPHAIKIALLHRKTNHGPLLPPLGLQFNFAGDTVTVEEFNAAEEPDIQSALPLADQIAKLLKDNEARTPKQIADQLNQKGSSIRTVLSRYKGKKWFRLTGDEEEKWTTL